MPDHGTSTAMVGRLLLMQVVMDAQRPLQSQCSSERQLQAESGRPGKCRMRVNIVTTACRFAEQAGCVEVVDVRNVSCRKC
jgi:hypothetical protein